MNGWSPDTCRALFTALGGTGNIAGITCCTTRLRIRLYDKNRADRTALSALPDIKGLIERTEELHLVIGLDAPDVCRLCSDELRAGNG